MFYPLGQSLEVLLGFRVPTSQLHSGLKNLQELMLDLIAVLVSSLQVSTMLNVKKATADHLLWHNNKSFRQQKFHEESNFSEG